MRDIEEAARAILAPMIFDAQPTSLAADQQTAIASWTYLRCLVLQAAADTAEPPRAMSNRVSSDGMILAPHWYHDLTRDHRPGTTCHIWIGALALPNNDFRVALHRSAQLDFPAGLPVGGLREAYYATFNVGHLIMRVFVHPFVADGVRSFGLAFNPNFGPSSLVPIFPVDLKSVHWPPNTLDLEQYVRLLGTVPVLGTASSV